MQSNYVYYKTLNKLSVQRTVVSESETCDNYFRNIL